MNEFLQFIEQRRVIKGMYKSTLCEGIISVSSYNRYLKGKDIPIEVVNGLLNKLGLKLAIAIDNIERL